MRYRDPLDAPEPPSTLRGLRKRFGDLKVRAKLVILHNLFFLVLTSSVYLTFAPATSRARWTLFLVLGAIYGLAVLLLEFVLMPLYVYRPLRLILEADRATRRGDRTRELIPAELLPRDELGRIMQSRNMTIAELRRQEDTLADALARLEQTAADLRRKNSMLEAARRNLAEQDRLASLGLLSASVAHELNTPLAVLHGSIEQLLENPADPITAERLRRMLRVTERLRRISESLLDFSRVRRQEMAPIPLRPLIDDAWALVAIDVKSAAVRFANLVPPEHGVHGNSDRLGQVFVNLLRNALHAVPAGGNIAVTSSRAAAEGAPCIAISVEDDGSGIPPHVLPTLFEAFVTTRLDAHSSGLGLTVAAGIVQQHGGTIQASNRPGGGAQLEVTLPEARCAVTS